MTIQKYLKRIAAITISAVLLLTSSGCKRQNTPPNQVSGVAAATPNAEFDEFLEELFLEEMRDNTLSLHFTLRDPSIYGLEDIEPTLGDFSDRDFENSEEDWDDMEGTFEELTSFDYETLDEKQQLTYDILYNYMQNGLSAKDLDYDSTAFGQITGVPSNMPLNMSLYEFYGKDDVEDYLVLMDQLDDYFDYCTDYEAYRTEKGYGMSDGAIDDAIEQIDTFLEHKEDNFLITTFDNRIDELDLSNSEKEAYKDRNRNIVLNTVIPSFETMELDLNSLRGKGEDKGGLCNYKDGKKYYEYLLRYKTGSAKTVPEMENTLKQVLDDSTEMIYDVYKNAPDVYMEYYGSQNFEIVGLSEPADFLEYYKSQMVGHFPTPPNVNYNISDIDPSIADNLSPAFCVTPYIDDYTNNVIQVNRSSTHNPGGLSATYAHEGYPGHLYQMTYFLTTDPYPIRDSLSFLGYDEGWAMYMEMRSYNLIDYKNYNSEYVREMYVAGDLQNIALCSLLDIYVNYYGYSVDELADYMDKQGFNGSAAQELYDLLVEEPGYYPQYFIGYLEFVELHDYAVGKLGSDFDEVAYHKVILETGPCDFTILRREIDEYIDSVKPSN